MGRLQDAWNILTGKALTMNNIGQPFASYNMINGTFVGISDNRTNYIIDGYQVNDVIYSVVSIITDKVAMPDWEVYKVIDEKAMRTYQGLMQKKNMTTEDIKLAQELKRKALEPVQVDRLSELMKYPNSYETMQDLVSASSGYKLLTGGRAIWAEMLDSGANQGKPYALHVLPYDQLSIIAKTNVFPIVEAGYTMTVEANLNFPKEQVLHDKYQNYQWDVNGSHLYGMSPLRSALRRISRSNDAVRASAAMFQNQGVKGVLYMDDPRVINGGASIMDSAKQVQAIKEKLTRGEWVGADNHGRIGVSGYKLGWQEVGLSPVDLAIIESEKWDLKRFCSVYGVPAQLVGDSETSTYNNVKEAEKALTTRCAMPLLVSFRNHLNRKLNSDWGYAGKGYFVDFDQTVFTELQEDIVEKSTWVNKLMGLSPNEQRNLLGLETIDNPLFDEPWVTPEMGMPLSEWAMDESQADLNVDTMKSIGEKVSFDFDGVLSTAKGKLKAKEKVAEGYIVYIISARSNKEPMLKVADEIGVPHSRVFATGSNKAKVAKIKQLGVETHYDNNPDVIDEIGEFTDGEIFD